MRIPAWERENFRLNKGNIFPSRKSLVSDIPAGEGKTAKPFFYGVLKSFHAKLCYHIRHIVQFLLRFKAMLFLLCVPN